MDLGARYGPQALVPVVPGSAPGSPRTRLGLMSKNLGCCRGHAKDYHVLWPHFSYCIRYLKKLEMIFAVLQALLLSNLICWPHIRGRTRMATQRVQKQSKEVPKPIADVEDSFLISAVSGTSA